MVNDKHQILLQEVERSKHLPSEIVKLMNEEGYARFNMHHHTQFWNGWEEIW